ncbi:MULTISPECIES: hypothetical protein [Priestia]|uniref:hypothetical protein n=1 Tax=Priestia TaxID=2800373 RepID=UPI0024683F6A|nr:hypothetical protein [Priestia megaterium]
MKNYLNVEEGKNSWKRYVSTTILASVFMLLGSVIYIIAEMIMVAADESGKSYFDFDSGVAVGINANLDFCCLILCTYAGFLVYGSGFVLFTNEK